MLSWIRSLHAHFINFPTCHVMRSWGFPFDMHVTEHVYNIVCFQFLWPWCEGLWVFFLFHLMITTIINTTMKMKSKNPIKATAIAIATIVLVCKPLSFPLDLCISCSVLGSELASLVLLVVILVLPVPSSGRIWVSIAQISNNINEKVSMLLLSHKPDYLGFPPGLQDFVHMTLCLHFAYWNQDYIYNGKNH